MLIHPLLGKEPHHLGFPALAWETLGDLGVESEKGRAWGGEGPQLEYEVMEFPLQSCHCLQGK